MAQLRRREVSCGRTQKRSSSFGPLGFVVSTKSRRHWLKNTRTEEVRTNSRGTTTCPNRGCLASVVAVCKFFLNEWATVIWFFKILQNPRSYPLGFALRYITCWDDLKEIGPKGGFERFLRGNNVFPKSRA